jgi:outer membrane protein TolC
VRQVWKGIEKVTPEYELALNAVREATRKFKTIRDSFRAGKATDSEYLAARKVYEEADRVYELAYASAAMIAEAQRIAKEQRT